MRGPIDYLVVEFDGNNFTGEIIAELKDAMDKGIIDVLDLAVIGRSPEGEVAAIEVTNFDGELAVDGGLISDEDIEEVGDLLEDDSSAGLLIIEHIWAKGLKEALLKANGTLIADGRIHPDAAMELEGGK